MKERSGMPYDVVAFSTDERAMRLSLEAEGAFHRLLRHAWINGSIPSDLRELAGICRTISSKQMQKIWKEIESLWQSSENNQGRLVNSKQERERQYKETKHLSAKESARKRWENKENVDANASRTSNASDVRQRTADAMLPIPPLPVPSLPIPPLKDSSNLKSPSVPIQRKNGRTNGSESDDFQKFWGPVEMSIRANVEPETFERLYAGIRITAMTGTHIVLAVQEALLMQDGDQTAAHLAAVIKHAGTSLMRDRKLEVMSIARFLEGALK